MLIFLYDIATKAVGLLANAATALAFPILFFSLLAFASKGRSLLGDVRRARYETRVNLVFYFLDAVTITPLLAVSIAALDKIASESGIYLPWQCYWEFIPTAVVCFVAIFVGDFIGYWRHRLEHTRLLWPSHAIHHSDTEMGWMTLLRFHPINRITTVAIDFGLLWLIGLPPFALVANGLVRHYYGFLIHADLPWTFGPLGRILVSPAMHRWHHAQEANYHGANFATVFSIFDQTFGTFKMPGLCITALGVSDMVRRDIVAQICHPLKADSYSRSTLPR
jgi:sterol desaturase/sphingolipid hydroxylase (fatty acid hydroxylase superfamily)